MFAWVRRLANRRFVLGCLAVAGLLGGSAAVRHFWPGGPGVNPDNLRKISLGMPEAEVEKLLGGPPQSSSPIQSFEGAAAYGPGFPDLVKPYPRWPPYPVWYSRCWFGDLCAIQVIFDDQGQVVARLCLQDTYAARTRRWLADQRNALWPEPPKARIKRLLGSFPGYEEDPKMTLGEVLDSLQDRYDIEFRIDAAEFGVQDAEELRQQPVGRQVSAKENHCIKLDEFLGRVKAAYVVEDGYVRIVPAAPK